MCHLGISKDILRIVCVREDFPHTLTYSKDESLMSDDKIKIQKLEHELDLCKADRGFHFVYNIFFILLLSAIAVLGC
jgi:hypothetical protein